MAPKLWKLLLLFWGKKLFPGFRFFWGGKANFFFLKGALFDN
jgi:hypothetical protein